MHMMCANTNPLSLCLSKLQYHAQLVKCLTTKHCSQQAPIILQYPTYLTSYQASITPHFTDGRGGPFNILRQYI